MFHSARAERYEAQARALDASDPERADVGFLLAAFAWEEAGEAARAAAAYVEAGMSVAAVAAWERSGHPEGARPYAAILAPAYAARGDHGIAAQIWDVAQLYTEADAEWQLAFAPFLVELGGWKLDIRRLDRDASGAIIRAQAQIVDPSNICRHMLVEKRGGAASVEAPRALFDRLHSVAATVDRIRHNLPRSWTLNTQGHLPNCDEQGIWQLSVRDPRSDGIVGAHGRDARDVCRDVEAKLREPAPTVPAPPLRLLPSVPASHNPEPRR